MAMSTGAPTTSDPERAAHADAESVPPASGDTTDAGDEPPRRWLRILLAVMCIGFAAFWIWALFFASKESVNRIGDDGWAERAEGICSNAQDEREGLVDLSQTDSNDPAALRRRADLVDDATGILDEMIDEIAAISPSDAKGQGIVPLWIDDYRTYLDDRRTYTAELREGENPDFRETAIDGIPISEKIERFAADNRMESCAPPTDMVLMRN